jgi:hypothetical protein
VAAAVVGDVVAELVAVAEVDLRQALALTADLAMRPSVPADGPIADSEQHLKNPMGVQMPV